MKFKRRLELKQGFKQIDIIPLINVVFLLLIFFILTSTLQSQPAIKVDLPKTLTSEIARFASMELLVTAEGAVYFKGNSLTEGQLKSLLHQAGKQNQSVLIKADKRAALAKVVEILDMARNSKIAVVNIATDQR